MKNVTERFLAQLHLSNLLNKLLPGMFTLRFISCPEFNLKKKYLSSDSSTNTASSNCVAYPSRWRQKPWPILLFYIKAAPMSCLPVVDSRSSTKFFSMTNSYLTVN